MSRAWLFMITAFHSTSVGLGLPNHSPRVPSLAVPVVVATTLFKYRFPWFPLPTIPASAGYPTFVTTVFSIVELFDQKMLIPPAPTRLPSIVRLRSLQPSHTSTRKSILALLLASPISLPPEPSTV